MDRSAALDIVESKMRWMQWGLGLRNWTIHVKLAPIDQSGNTSDETTLARCFYSTRYRQATVFLDHENIDDEEELLRFLRHEMLHLTIAPFASVEETGESIARGRRERKIFRDQYVEAMELSLVNLERMLDAMGLNADRIIELTRESMASWNAPDLLLTEDDDGVANLEEKQRESEVESGVAEPEWLPLGAPPDREGIWQCDDGRGQWRVEAVGSGELWMRKLGGGRMISCPLKWFVHEGRRYRYIGPIRKTHLEYSPDDVHGEMPPVPHT